MIPSNQFYELSFYTLSEEEIKTKSCVNIINKENMKNDKPVENGIYDSHMGTTDYNWICKTCENKRNICPGHFGSINLKFPVKSPLYREELLKWLKVLCYHCSEFITPIPNLPANKKLTEMIKNAKNVKKCPHCLQEHLQVIKDKKRHLTFLRIKEPINKKQTPEQIELDNLQIISIIEKVKDSQIIDLGKPLRCHPKNFIIKTLIVSPNTIRPDTRRIGSLHNTNSDTTTLIKTIVETNLLIPDNIPSDPSLYKNFKDSCSLLELTVNTMIKGGSTGSIKMLTNTNKTPVSIVEHFPKKTGRIRRNLMGKRVEYMIRSVIIGDCSLQINQVGIPKKHAAIMEIPETVTPENIARLTTYFNNKKTYPGCSRIQKKSNNRICNRDYIEPDYTLQPGDIIYRHLIDGDYVLFNRQPTLLFSNIAGMKVKVVSGDSLRINVLVCGYFNADFDGDNMNAIVLQNIQSRSECMHISKVARWMISPQKMVPMVGNFQDSLLGIAELTRSSISLNKFHVLQILSNINIPVDYSKIDTTNKSYLISSLLLPDITLTKKSTFYKEQYSNMISYNPQDTKVIIQKGQHISGIIDKGTSGKEVANSIYHIIANKYSVNLALDTVFSFQQVALKYMYYQSYTIGIKDIIVPQSAKDEIKIKIENMIAQSLLITQKLNSNKLISPIGIHLKDFYEAEQSTVLSVADDFVNPIISTISPNNGIFKLINYGSKGQITNFISINGAIGSTTINGKRFIDYQSGYGRNNPYFTRFDYNPESNGFVPNSFSIGTDNSQYIYAAAEARNAAINNAMTTSTSGHANRISNKNLETMIVSNTRSVNKLQNVVQILYGEFGLNPAKLEKVLFPTVLISDQEFEKYNMTKIFPGNEFVLSEFEQLTQDRENFRKKAMELEDNNPKDNLISDYIYTPVNITRIIEDIQPVNTNSIKSKAQFIIEAILKVKSLCDSIGYVFTNEIQRSQKRKIPDYIKYSCENLCILIRSYLCIYKIQDFTLDQLNLICTQIYYTFKMSLIEYGNTAGILAAQCISEPLTQYVLDSKHRVGAQVIGKTSTIVRYQEILGAKTELKNPHMTIMVKPEYEKDKSKVQEIANHIEMVDLQKFIKSIQVFYEEYGNPVHKNFIHEKDLIKKYETHTGQIPPNDLAKWCIRLSISLEDMILKTIKLETIISVLKKKHPQLYFIHTAENSKEIFIRVYFKTSMHKMTVDYLNVVIIPTINLLKNTIIRGVKNIISANLIDISKSILQPDGSYKIQKIYGIITQGTNLSDILDNPFIDPYRTQTDSIKEMEEIFGITCAREKIISEMSNTLSGINRIHLTIYADEMSYTGNISSIQRTGLFTREKSNVTLKLSFQMPVQVIQDSSINGMTDHLTGISSFIILGTVPSVGTTYNKICINEVFVKDEIKKTNDELDML